MNVYILMSQYNGDNGESDSGIVAVFKTPEGAKAYAGEAYVWVEHNSHGRCWSAVRTKRSSYWIDEQNLIE